MMNRVVLNFKVILTIPYCYYGGKVGVLCYHIYFRGKGKGLVVVKELWSTSAVEKW